MLDGGEEGIRMREWIGRVTERFERKRTLPSDPASMEPQSLHRQVSFIHLNPFSR